MIVQEPVQAAIWHCLNHYAYQDAAFLAERLFAEVDTDEALFLLATCYYRLNQPLRAFWLLRRHQGSSPQCRYLLARCAMDLNKLNDAEGALMGSGTLTKTNMADLVKEFGDEASYALQLLANIYAQTEQTNKSIRANREALKLNPFLWQSFINLCNCGDTPDPNSIFQITSDSQLPHHGYTLHGGAEHTGTQNLTVPVEYSTPIMSTITHCMSAMSKMYVLEESPLAVPFSVSGVSIPMAPACRQLLFCQMSSGGTLSPITPSFGFLPLDSSQVNYLTPPSQTAALTEANDQKAGKKTAPYNISNIRAQMGQLMGRKENPLQISKPPVFSQSGNVNNSTPQSPIVQPILSSSQSVRRSSRLFSNSYSVKENNKSPNRNKFTTPKSPSRKTNKRISKTNINKTNFNELNERNKEKIETVTSENKVLLNNNINAAQSAIQHAITIQKQSVEGLMSLLRQLGQAYLHMTQFTCKKAVECLQDVTPRQYNTGWVLTTLGVSYVEMTEYDMAIKYFEEAHELEPHNLDRMEIYSTALWHLQKEVALSALAQKLLAQNRLSPISLLVAGNCFSLHKEHDTAIKFFERAVQVDSKCTYAYTLLGHELVNTEELDKAMSCFRNAIRLNPRHYNAWFGIGTIYSKQERFQLAEIHFMRALAINPQSSVLMCHIGVVQHALGKTDNALQTLNSAITLDPKNPLSKFHRGSIYFAIGRNQDALTELEELKEIVPKESLVYYLIGKVHKKLGNVHLALMHFSWATDLDPKGANNQIKEAFDPNTSGQPDEENTETNNTNSVNATLDETPIQVRLFGPELDQELSDVDVSY